MKKAVFKLDGLCEGLQGLNSGNYWNGWCVPLFTEDVVRELVDLYNSFKSNDSILTFECGVLCEFVDGKMYTISAGQLINDVVYYEMDCGWCFEKVDDAILKENASKDDVKKYLNWLSRSEYAYHIDESPKDVIWKKSFNESMVDLLENNSKIMWKFGSEFLWNNYDINN
jgi:hypothetical protein